MANKQIVVHKSRGSNVFDLDRRTQQELVVHSNQMHARVELVQEATEAISKIVVFSQYQAACAAIQTEAIKDMLAEAGVDSDEYEAYIAALQHGYLQEMGRLTLKAAHLINEQVE